MSSPHEKTTADIRYGIADGRWITRGRIDFNKKSIVKINNFSVTISAPYQDGNEIKVDVKVPAALVDAC